MPLGWPELIVILVIVLLVLGPKRLPSLGRQLGGGMREFKDAITSKDKGASDEDEQPEQPADRAALPSGEAQDAPAAAARDESATRSGG